MAGASLCALAQDQQPTLISLGDSVQAAPAAPARTLPNYRYVDMDRLLDGYTMAREYNAKMVTLQNDFEAKAKKHQQNIEYQTKQIQKKMEGRLYKTEIAYNADMKKLQKAQETAEAEMKKLQEDLQKKMVDYQALVMDSVTKYVAAYNAGKHYDAILLKAATLFIEPDLDITAELLTGLNFDYAKQQTATPATAQ